MALARPGPPMPPEALRLFVAVELPADVREAVASIQKRLSALDPNRAVRWTAVDHIHLTLKFLGETAPDKRPAIEAAMREAIRGSQPFYLSVKGVGCFPDLRKPRIVWVGTAGDLETLQSLRDAVERTISPLGYPTESRPFSPHLTVGRARQEASRSALGALGDAVGKLKVEPGPDWPIRAISLMRSDLKPSGAVYTRLAEVPLEG